MALFYKAFVSTLFESLLHTQHLQHRGCARRVLQDVLIDTSALRTGGDGNGGISIPSAFAPTLAPISSNQSQYYDPTSSSFATVSHFSPSVAIIVVILLSAFFFMGFFTLYVRRCADSSSSTSSGARGSLRRADYLQGQQDQGVDPELLHSLPLIAYSSAKKRGNNIECVVCLADFEEQEPLRQLPGCKHVFHPDCIDMWLFSHSTCPLCRCNITRSSGSFSLRWGGSGNIRQFLGGGGGSGQQLGLLGGGGGSGQQLSATESIGMVVHADVPESNDTIIRIPRGLSTEMVAAAQGNDNPAAGTSISNFLQLPFAGMGANSANQSVRAAAAGGEGNFPPRSRAMLNMDVRRKQTTCLARANSTGHSLQVEASPLLSIISSGDSSCSRTASIYRSSSEMVKQHGNLQGL